MWQVAVAAAVAGTGIIANHIFSSNSQNPTSKTNQTEHNHELSEEEHHLFQSPQISTTSSFNGTQFSSQNGSNCSSVLNQNEGFQNELKDGGFRFSSFGCCNSSGCCSSVKKLRNLGKKTRGSDKILGLTDNGSVNHKRNCGKKVLVRLKRRKIGRNLNEKCDSSLSKDCSSFGWGLGLGMMYMMSAGKADINKLTNSIDETAKVVNELKSELSKQKSVSRHQLLNSNDSRSTVDSMKAVSENLESCLMRHDMKNGGPLSDSDYASSVLTEEQPNEGAEMDQLEAELESELLKLPWCHIETSENEDKLTNFIQIERHESVNQSSSSYHSDGVPPAELKSKLSAVLIEQQESQISELESELNLAYSKLHEKEDELQALKDCVKRLTEFSLTNISDEETEFCQEEPCEKLDHLNIGVADKAVVGGKRTMHLRACN